VTNWQSNLRTAWRGGLRPSDIRIAVIAAAIQIGATAGSAHRHGHGSHVCWWASSCREPSHLDALAYALLALGPVALLVRRHHPRAVLAFVFGATLLYVVLGYPQGPNYLSPVFAVMAAARAGDRIAARVALVAGWVAFLWLPAALGITGGPTVLATLAIAAWLLVALAGAEGMQVRRERAAEARRARELQAHRQADEERLRIARELHDVLAHNISLINVQSGVALHLIDEQPEQARTALAAINDASAEALREVRSVLGVLRGTGEQPPRAPTAGVARLDDLVSRATAAGLEVSLDISGERRALPASIDLAAFRIVQESLTNVVRHAGAGAATVTLTYGSSELTVQVDDDGRGADGSRSGGGSRTGGGSRSGGGSGAGEAGLGMGSGIAGMRERATALGGSLDAGPLPAGGFRVRASLPLSPGSGR
jgi:signal transduction histidine kinase